MKRTEYSPSPPRRPFHSAARLKRATRRLPSTRRPDECWKTSIATRRARARLKPSRSPRPRARTETDLKPEVAAHAAALSSQRSRGSTCDGQTSWALAAARGRAHAASAASSNRNRSIRGPVSGKLRRAMRNQPVNRRTFLAGAAAGAGALLLPTPAFSRRLQLPLARDVAFAQGVASGQPATSGITLWTKLDGLTRDARLQVEISPDEDFRRVIYRKSAMARASTGTRSTIAPSTRCSGPASVTSIASSPARSTALSAASRPPGRPTPASPCGSRSSPARTTSRATTPPTPRWRGSPTSISRSASATTSTRSTTTTPRCARTPREPTGTPRSRPCRSTATSTRSTTPTPTSARSAPPTRCSAIWDDHEVEDNWARDQPGSATDNPRVPFPSAAPAASRRSSSTIPRMRVAGDP